MKNFTKNKIGLFSLVLFCLLALTATNPANASTSPYKSLVEQMETQKISLSIQNASLKTILSEINKQTHIGFVINVNVNQDDLKNLSLNVKDETVNNSLNTLLENTNYKHAIVENEIVVLPKTMQVTQSTASQQSYIELKGKVVDIDGEPVIGATLIAKSGKGAITDYKGLFILQVSANEEIEVSYVGMVTKKISYKESVADLIITLDADDLAVEDVVVTGFFNRNKETFTGSSKTLSSEELKRVSSTSAIAALSILTPGLNIVADNAQGSNPNNIPELVLRGTSSLTTDGTSTNYPLIILDGLEISITDLYDLDINEIERVDVLKDASATALYGERAANGVIVIERSAISTSPITVKYNSTIGISTPDVSTYDYLNAAEKLDFEVLAGLYTFEYQDYSAYFNDFDDYNQKKILVAQGQDTDWMRQAIRTGITANNSLELSGRSGNLQYRVKGNYNLTRGVMKEDSRSTKSFNAYLQYRAADKVSISFQTTYSQTDVENTPYGTFSSYAKLNPYDSPYDEYGNVVETLSYDITNPLYEATVGNFNNSRSSTLTNAVVFRYDYSKNLYVTANGSVVTGRSDAQVFTSPDSQTQADLAVNERGKLYNRYGSSSSYSGNAVINYNNTFNNDHTLSLHLGGEIYSSNSYSDAYTTYGFMNNELYYNNFALGYSGTASPVSSNSMTTRVGAYLSGTYSYQNKYYVEGTLRYSGSSQFGANNRYAPFWSLGAGWNIHKESFMEGTVFENLRLRYSYGVTGTVAFSAYQAMTTYTYSTDYYYWNGMGAVPITMGNDDLVWQTTTQNNIGLNIIMFDNRLSATFDYYRNTTDDMLIELSIPSSIGVSSVYDNLGKMRNSGYEFDVTGVLFQNKDWRVQVTANGAHNKNTILAISSGLDKYNDENSYSSGTPSVLYKEGESSTAIYAVESLGINPSTGNEIFVTLDGDLTETYSSDDKVVVGDYTPSLEGVIYPYITYRNFSLSVAMSYTYGGQIYNSTRANNVENVNAEYNVDRRAYEERWISAGDISVYRDIADDWSLSYVQSSRFVEDDNTLSITSVELGYEFNANLIDKIGFKRLRIAGSMTDVARLSTVYYERGTTYPFARGFNFSLNATF